MKPDKFAMICTLDTPVFLQRYMMESSQHAGTVSLDPGVTLNSKIISSDWWFQMIYKRALFRDVSIYPGAKKWLLLMPKYATVVFVRILLIFVEFEVLKLDYLLLAVLVPVFVATFLFNTTPSVFRNIRYNVSSKIDSILIHWNACLNDLWSLSN